MLAGAVDANRLAIKLQHRVILLKDDGKLLVQADLPGMRREDINVQIEQDAIVIQGERKAGPVLVAYELQVRG